MKGSYSNPIRFILGIDMVRISCFKHEREILLYSQTLPIQSTKALDEDDETMVDHLMFTLKSTKEHIADKDMFLRKTGITLRDRWIQMMELHPMLMEPTEYVSKPGAIITVQQRLVEELGFIWWPQHIDIYQLKEFIGFNGTKFWVPRDKCIYIPMSVSRVFPDCTFGISVNGTRHQMEYQFDDVAEFCIPMTAVSLDLNSYNILTLMVGPKDCAFSQVALLKIHCNRPLYQYEFSNQDAVQINRVLNVVPLDEEGDNGKITIQSTSEIIVSSSCGIDASNTGLDNENDSYLYERHLENASKDAMHLTFGTKIMDLNDLKNIEYMETTADYGTDSEEMNFSSLDSASGSFNVPLPLPLEENVKGGGGIIALRSGSDILNDGVLRSNGSDECGYEGGTICLCAEDFVVNRGDIACTPSGRIIFQCRRFVNEGVITPAPKVIILGEASSSHFQILNMPRPQEIPLSVYDHHGHHGPHHPRNLLVANGRETGYVSSAVSGTNDWFIFKIESACVCIPKAIIIRNSASECGVRSIELSLATDEAEDKFDAFDVIHDIQQNDRGQQFYDLKDTMLNAATLWDKNYKFIKVKLLNNFGGDKNSFYFFSVTGFIFPKDEQIFDYFRRSLQRYRVTSSTDAFLSSVGVPWNEVPLKVISHRGHHYNTDHPQNLLDENGTRTAYESMEPAVGDWITFMIQTPNNVTPKIIIIRYGLTHVATFKLVLFASVFEHHS